jgi:hypothetical protein
MRREYGPRNAAGRAAFEEVPTKPKMSAVRKRKRTKSFFEMTEAEKDAVAAELAKCTDYGKTRPLSARDRAIWARVNRGRRSSTAESTSKS